MDTEAELGSAQHTTIPSPLGELTVVTRGHALSGLYFPGHWYRPDPTAFGAASPNGFDEIRRELSEYFSGRRRGFDVALTAEGNEFEQKVWELVRLVPYGETSTYGALARLLGDATRAREVGVAVGRNPLSILIPCHRIVGSNGQLTGYAGGLGRKQYLLDLEKNTVGPSGRLF